MVKWIKHEIHFFTSQIDTYWSTDSIDQYVSIRNVKKKLWISVNFQVYLELETFGSLNAKRIQIEFLVQIAKVSGSLKIITAYARVNQNFTLNTRLLNDFLWINNWNFFLQPKITFYFKVTTLLHQPPTNNWMFLCPCSQLLVSGVVADAAVRLSIFSVTSTLRRIGFLFLSNWMKYDRSDSFPFNYEPDTIPFGSWSKI